MMNIFPKFNLIILLRMLRSHKKIDFINYVNVRTYKYKSTIFFESYFNTGEKI